MKMRNFNPPDLKNALQRRVGAYQLALVYRYITNDKGPTIHILGPVATENREIIRFDCFEREPHYHLGISYLAEPVVTIEASKPLSWVLEELEEYFPEYLKRSRADNKLPCNWRSLIREVTKVFRTKAAEWE